MKPVYQVDQEIGDRTRILQVYTNWPCLANAPTPNQTHHMQYCHVTIYRLNSPLPCGTSLISYMQRKLGEGPLPPTAPVSHLFLQDCGVDILPWHRNSWGHSPLAWLQPKTPLPRAPMASLALVSFGARGQCRSAPRAGMAPSPRAKGEGRRGSLDTHSSRPPRDWQAGLGGGVGEGRVTYQSM